MVGICEEAIQKPGTRIIRIARLIRHRMMHMVGDDIDLLRNYIDGQIPRDKSPEPVTKRIGAVRAIPVIPDSAMGTHNYHAIYKSNGHQVEMEISKKEDKQAGKEDHKLKPTEEGQPILFSPEDIQSEPKFPHDLPGSRNDQAAFPVLPSIGGRLQNVIDQVLFPLVSVDRMDGGKRLMHNMGSPHHAKSRDKVSRRCLCVRYILLRIYYTIHTMTPVKQARHVENVGTI